MVITSKAFKSNNCIKKPSYSLRILGFEPVEQGIFVEGSSGSTVTVVPLDIGDGV